MNTRKLERLLALVAGATQATVELATLVTAPSILVRHTQSYSNLYDLGLRLVDKWSVQAEVQGAKALHGVALHPVERCHELWTAVRVNVGNGAAHQRPVSRIPP